ncbi:hypothetical protein Tco_0654109 [Tanacetum coccineum]|uniref:Uncharacterized protein n=1 Tax=Tanacetum coccineum TaxID=301880 RepID=A0ABQ4X2H0_9ASTR
MLVSRVQHGIVAAHLVSSRNNLNAMNKHPNLSNKRVYLRMMVSASVQSIKDGLRIDMVRLQEQMNSLQSTLETCMKMQHELQPLVQQEVWSALSRLSTSGEDSLETCFLCCDNSSYDFFSDRCGCVHVCSNCAKKINWSKLKESVRHLHDIKGILMPQPPMQQIAKTTTNTAVVSLPLVPSSSKLVKPPARPGFGSVGKKIMITANHFLIQLGDRYPHQYDFDNVSDHHSRSDLKNKMQTYNEMLNRAVQGFSFREIDIYLLRLAMVPTTVEESVKLSNRRRVSNLLQNGFGLRLDELLPSHVERKQQASQSKQQESVFENDGVSQAVQSSKGALSSPPAIPQLSGTEREIINGLRIDMVRLLEQMNSLQNTLETCMKMQHELQRSVQQEVWSALSRLSTSGEDSLETCFLCCDNSSYDFSSDRCGRVHVCSNCAKKINWSKLKKSVRHP